MLALPRILINGGRRGFLVGIDPAVCAGSWARSRCSARWQNRAGDARAASPIIRHQESALEFCCLRWPATLAAYLIGSLSFAVHRQPRHGPERPAHLRQQEPRRHQRAALRQQGSGGRRRCCSMRSRAGCRWWLVKWWGEAYGLGDGTVALVGLAAFLGHLFPVFFRFAGRQGRGHCRGRAGGRRALAWAGRAGHLADHRVLFSLFVAGLHRRGGVCAGLLPVWASSGLGRPQCHGAEPGGHGRAAALAPRREHQPPAGGQGKPPGSQEA